MSFDPVQAHHDLADRLASFSALADVAVVTERPRDFSAGASLVNAIDQAFAAITGKGAAIMVLLPDLGGSEPGDRVHFGEVQFDIVCFTNELFASATGGARLRAVDLAKHVISALHGTVIRGSLATLSVARVEPFRLESLPEEIAALYRDQGLAGWAVRLGTAMEAEPVTKVATPTISETGGTVTLACATSGAAIYYTTDGTYPGSGNPDANLYSAPFALTEACTLRVAAQKSGLQSSDVAQAAFAP